MKAFFVAILLFSSNALVFSQEADTKQGGSPESKRGFKSLLLDMDIDSVKGARFLKTLERDGFQSEMYEINNEDLMKLGELEVDQIFVRTFRKIVYGIDVTMKKDVRVMKALEKIYGASTYDGINQTYFWRMDDFNIRFKSKDKRHIEITYHSLTYQAMIKDEKAKKIKSISDDF